MSGKIMNPVLVGLVSGLLASFGLVYYVSNALSPGILGTLALVVVGFLFGIFVALLSGTTFFVISLKKIFGCFDNCAYCKKQMPNNAAFCPHCGKQTVHLSIVKF
ncbi:MAG: zinc ribbon domain-containing protein [Candidatus Aenigmatarchaeota archaeon]